MNIYQNILFIWPKTALFLLALIVWSCSTSTSLDDEGKSITLINRTTQPLIYTVKELGTSLQIDPGPFNVNPEAERLLPPEASVILTNEDIEKNQEEYNRGDGIRIFVWEVAGDSAFIKAGMTFTNRKLEQRQFRVEIEEGVDGSLVAGSA